jgi:hypothetical protein
VSSAGDLSLDAVFSVLVKKSGSTNATINQFGIGLAGSNLSSGIGIAFPATQSASSDANTLDDYEEGTFTPTTIGTTTTGSVTYGTRNGSYTKIGNAVHFQLRIGWSAHSGTGNLRITDLPFTSKNITNAIWACAVSYSELVLPAPTSNKQLTAEIPANQAYINLIGSDAGGLAAAGVAVDASVAYIILTGTYFTD